MCLNPFPPPEEGEHREYDQYHGTEHDFKGERVVLRGQGDVHAVDARYEGEGEEDNRDDSQHLNDVVDAAIGEGGEGIAEALDNLFVVFEGVPYLAQVVGDVAEVLVHLFS